MPLKNSPLYMCMRLAAIVVSELMLDKAVHDKFASGLVKKKNGCTSTVSYHVPNGRAARLCVLEEMDRRGKRRGENWMNSVRESRRETKLGEVLFLKYCDVWSNRPWLYVWSHTQCKY